MKKLIFAVAIALSVNAFAFEHKMVSGAEFQKLTGDIGYQDENGDWWVKNRDTWYTKSHKGMKKWDLICTTKNQKVICTKWHG